ncbi:MAG: HK97 family phage prohead protease [Bacteroidales bacterium]|nr:HK97 family phage prohead protease [Bacteroidales bacterium]
MGKRVRISNESLNSYGTRILTEGLDIAQYQRNPVLLLMHERGKVIGYVKNIKKENGEVTGELEFDEASPESVRVKKQFEFGSLKMVSAGIDILELSEDPEFLVQGQTRPTVTKSKLFEVSVVDIGGNDDALVLSQNGATLELAKDGSNPLPLLNNKPSKQSKEMELKDFALMLGLEATADESAVRARVQTLLKAEGDVKTLSTEKEQLTLAAITKAVETGITQKRIPAEKKEHFITLGKTMGLESLQETINAMSPTVKLSAVLNPGGAGEGKAEFTKLSEVPADKLQALRKDDRETYIRLFKAEYGFEPSFDED